MLMVMMVVMIMMMVMVVMVMLMVMLVIMRILLGMFFHVLHDLLRFFQGLEDPLLELWFWREADNPIHFNMLDEDAQGWNPLNVEERGDLRMIIRVELAEFHPITKLVTQLFKDGRHHLTWRAPFRPEVNNHGLV